MLSSWVPLLVPSSWSTTHQRFPQVGYSFRAIPEGKSSFQWPLLRIFIAIRNPCEVATILLASLYFLAITEQGAITLLSSSPSASRFIRFCFEINAQTYVRSDPSALCKTASLCAFEIFLLASFRWINFYRTKTMTSIRSSCLRVSLDKFA